MSSRKQGSSSSSGSGGVAVPSAASKSGINSTTIELQELLVQKLQEHEDGLSDEDIRKIFGDRYGQDLVQILNHLLSLNRLQLFHKGDILIYKLIREETAIKFEGLGPEQMLVYQVCEKASNRGIWTRDIKVATNIPQHTLTKTLKILEQRNLIKSVRSVVSKSKKLYMLYDVIPAKEITGGPWYTDQEFDSEFVDHLRDHIVEVVRHRKMADLNEINADVISSGISSIVLSLDELESVLKTLVYDGRLEELDRYLVDENPGSSSGGGGGGMSSSHNSSSNGGGMEIVYEDDDSYRNGNSSSSSGMGSKGKKGGMSSSSGGGGTSRGGSKASG